MLYSQFTDEHTEVQRGLSQGHNDSKWQSRVTIPHPKVLTKLFNALQGHNYGREADHRQHHDKHHAFFHMLCAMTIMPRGIKIAGSFLAPCRLPSIEAISIIHRIQPSSKLSGKS